MTFAARPHQVLGPTLGVQSLGAMQLTGATPSSGARGVNLYVNTDGTLTYLNQMADPVFSSVPANWYTPTTTAIGSSYRVRFTLQSGDAWDAGLTAGTWYAISAQRAVAWTVTTTDRSRIATVLVEFAAVGNDTVLGSGTLNVDILNEF